MPLRSSTLDELGDRSAEPGSRPWTQAGRIDAWREFKDGNATVKDLKISLKAMIKYKGWKSVSQRDGTAFVSFEHFCQTPFSDGGLGIPSDIALKILREKDHTRLIGDVIVESRLPGNELPDQEIGKGKPGPGRGNKTDDNINRLMGGADPSYLIRRMLRDCPEYVDQLEAGDYPSVRQAAIAAGIVKVPTPLELFKRSVRRLSDEERTRGFSWLKTEYGVGA